MRSGIVGAGEEVDDVLRGVGGRVGKKSGGRDGETFGDVFESGRVGESGERRGKGESREAGLPTNGSVAG